MALTVTWDETSPAGSQQRSLGDDRIREFKTQVREVMAGEHIGHNGSSITSSNLTESRHKLSSIGLLGLLKGLRIEQRSYVTSGNITISKGLQIEINGDICSIGVSDISLVFSGLSTSTSYYIYVSTATHEGTLTASNFSYATAAADLPSYDATRKGWYGSGNKRAIGFFYCEANSKMMPFVHDSLCYSYVNAYQMYATYVNWILNNGTATTATEITGIANYIPVFVGDKAIFIYDVLKNATTSIISYIGSDSNCMDVQIYLLGSSSNLRLAGTSESTLSIGRTLYYKNATSAISLYIGIKSFMINGSL